LGGNAITFVTTDWHAATKGYVDAAITNFIHDRIGVPGLTDYI